MSDKEFEAEMNRQMDELGIPEPPNILIAPEQSEVLKKSEEEE